MLLDLLLLSGDLWWNTDHAQTFVLRVLARSPWWSAHRDVLLDVGEVLWVRVESEDLNLLAKVDLDELLAVISVCSAADRTGVGVVLVWHAWVCLCKRNVLKVGWSSRRVLAAVAEETNVSQAVEESVSNHSGTVVRAKRLFLPGKSEENDGCDLKSDLATTGKLKRKVDNRVVGKVEETGNGQNQCDDNVDKDADAAIEAVVLSDHEVDEAESIPCDRKGKLNDSQSLNGLAHLQSTYTSESDTAPRAV